MGNRGRIHYRATLSVKEESELRDLRGLCENGSVQEQKEAFTKIGELTGKLSPHKFKTYVELSVRVIAKELEKEDFDPELVKLVLDTLRESITKYSKTSNYIKRDEVTAIYEIAKLVAESPRYNHEPELILSAIQTINRANSFGLSFTDETLDFYIEASGYFGNDSNSPEGNYRVPEAIAQAFVTTIACVRKAINPNENNAKEIEQKIAKTTELINALAGHKLDFIRKELAISLGKVHYRDNNGSPTELKVNQAIDEAINRLEKDPSSGVAKVAETASTTRLLDKYTPRAPTTGTPGRSLS